MKATYVAIGNSAAALSAVDRIRQGDASGRILILNREAGPAYSRVALPYFVSGQLTREQLMIRGPADYARLGAELVEDALVVRVDAEARTVELAGGRHVSYERLLIATGSRCVIPPIEGLADVSTHSLWTLDDALALKAAAQDARSALIIGGGFIGMLAAEALRKVGVALTVVEAADQLLPQLLDDGAAARFLPAVRDAGVTVHLGSRVERVGADGRGVLVELSDGRRLRADLLLLAAGVQPDLSVAAATGCSTGRGVLVNDRLETSCAGVYAAGDVAEVRDFLDDTTAVHAIWPSAVEQGRIAGANMAGADLCYDGSLGMNVVELFGLTLAQVGRFRVGPGDESFRLGEAAGSRYRHVVVGEEGRVVGAMYLGDANGVAEMGVLHGLIRRRTEWGAAGVVGAGQVSYAATVREAGRT